MTLVSNTYRGTKSKCRLLLTPHFTVSRWLKMKNSVKRRTKKNFLEPSHFQYGNYKCVAVIFLFLSGCIHIFLSYSSTFNSGLLPDAEAHLEFEAWFVAKGGKSMGIEVSNFSSMGKGVLANKDIKRGDDVLFIPKELIL